MSDQEATPLAPHSVAEFVALTETLEDRLNALLASEVFGRGPGRVRAPETRGVYLFSERCGSTLTHLYVGRVGRTERAALAGKPGHSNFRTRLRGHSAPGSTHTQATFAYRLTVEALGDAINGMPDSRADRCADKTFDAEYSRQKQRVTNMEFRIVEINDDFECYVFEPYAAFRLGTPYNSWATS